MWCNAGILWNDSCACLGHLHADEAGISKHTHIYAKCTDGDAIALAAQHQELKSLSEGCQPFGNTKGDLTLIQMQDTLVGQLLRQ